MGELLCHYSKEFHQVAVPKDYLILSLKAMKHLESSGKVNVLYELARGLGTMRRESTDSCFPTTRMPFGMLQYMVMFFNSEPNKSVSLTMTLPIDAKCIVYIVPIVTLASDCVSI